MNESAAGEVLLLRAFETTGCAPWTDEDRAWASRSALQAVGADAPAEAFLAARAQAGLRRLAPHDALLPRWQALRPWRGEWLALAAVLAFIAGVAVDRIGSAQRINLLAPPVWALLAWNLAVYVGLLVGALRGAATPGALRRALASAWRRWRRRSWPPVGGASAPAWQRFAADWAESSVPLQGARIAQALHLGAAALALGLMAGMYLRGLVLDYRVSWESTFLDAGTVHAVLSALLAPASALSGIAVPDVAGLQALRSPRPGMASAAPWIHLYALQLLLWVVLPRLALALWAGARARKLQRHFPLPLGEPYFQRLIRQQRGGAMPVRVWPHARVPDERALATLKRLLVDAFGEGAALTIAPTVAYGAEDEPLDAGADGALRVVLCELGATPEPESQGRLLRALTPRGAAPPLLLVDEAAFVRRFGAASPRLAERRQAWRALVDALAGSVVFADLHGADQTAAEGALQSAVMPPPARD
jgi:hypothetical protein